MLSQIALTIVSLLAISSYKYLPFAYSIRFYNCILKYLYFKKNIKSESPFTELIRTNNCCLLECDFFGFHKNNVTYFTELDISRMETFLRSLNYYFTSTCQKDGKKIPFIPLASIQNHFLKEIKPFQNYKMYTKIIAWGDKWMWTITLFTIKEKSKSQNTSNTAIDLLPIPESIPPLYYNNERICCISIGKLVAKENRKTLKPFDDIIKFSNFNTEKVDEFHLKATENEKLIAKFSNNPIELLYIYNNTI